MKKVFNDFQRIVFIIQNDKRRTFVKILVLGGSSFFGKMLVEKLISQNNNDVTIATRGLTKIDDDISSKVKHVVVDRTDYTSLMSAFGKEHFDVIYDQICFNPIEAKIAVDVFSGHVKRYVFTSSMAVYNGSEEVLIETDFDPSTYSTDLSLDTYSYKEGKRQAEAYFYQNSPFPVISVRPPLVISSDDKRFAFYINKVVRKEPIGTLGSSTLSFISANEVANFLYHIGTKTDFTGPIHLCNSGYYNTEELAKEIGKVVNVPPLFDKNEKSPYCLDQTLKISNQLANSIGFTFRSTESVIHELVNDALRGMA